MILIAGAGIGGLTLALSLHQIGVPCRVFEAVDALAPLGVGINLQPHAIKELDALGLVPELDRIGVRTAEVAYFSAHGSKIWVEPRGERAGYKWPQFSIHRGHLQMLLFEEVLSRLGPGAIQTGSRVTRWESRADGVDVALASGETLRGDLFIAADGIHSAARAHLYPDEGAPLWAGVLMWRGTTWGKPFLSGRSMAMAGHGALKFVTYPIGERDGANGPEVLINWVADVKFPDDHEWAREDWRRKGDVADLEPLFGTWRFPWLDIAQVIASTPEVLEWPMVDRDPLPKWTHGRMTLLGDAAHPMYPIGSNGASQAILDARVLVREIRDKGAIPAALQAYEAERLPVTSKVVLANRDEGPDKAMDVVHQRAPDGFDRLEDVISQDELAEIAARYKATAGMDIERLNAAPAILEA
ncbi:MAG: flavin-dependent oxidoreductase [Paracoccaceae bacterium]